MISSLEVGIALTALAAVAFTLAAADPKALSFEGELGCSLVDRSPKLGGGIGEASSAGFLDRPVAGVSKLWAVGEV